MSRMSRMWPPLSRPQWAQELDFVGPRVRTAPWAWALLLAGLVAVATELPLISQADADLLEAQTTLKRLQRAAHQQRLAAATPRASQAEGDAVATLTPESARRAAQVAQWLAYPWMAVIGQAESAAHTEQAVLLSFNLDLATLGSAPDAWPAAHVSAAVRDDASALRWAQAHGAHAQLLSRERLAASFESVAGTYDGRAEAMWPGGAP